HVLLTIDTGMTIERAVQFIKGGFSFRAGRELGMRSYSSESEITFTRIRSNSSWSRKRLAFSARSRAFRNPEFGLLRWDQIKFAGRLFVEQRAFFLISAAPMLVPSGNTYEVTRAHALLTGVVLVQIGALDHDKPDIVRVSVHSGVETRHELSER